MRIVISGIPIDVQKKNIKNMHLQVKPPDGHVVISAPLSVDDKAIEAYARTQLGFIKRAIAQFQDQPRASKRQYVSGETMYIWGKQYFLVFKPDNQKNSFEIQNQNIVLSMSAKSTVKQRDAYVKEEYRKILKEEIEKRLPKWEAQTGLKCDSWQTKYMVTKWGACSTGKKKLWFNLQLAQKPYACLDYIILHELTHLITRKHDATFIAHMDKCMPNWREIRKELNDSRLDYYEAQDESPLQKLIDQSRYDDIRDAAIAYIREERSGDTKRLSVVDMEIENVIHIEQPEDGVIAFDVITSCDVEMSSASHKGYFNERWLTAAELIVERADYTKEHMGLTTWADAPEGKIKKSDVTVAKNYLSQDEMKQLNRMVTAYLDFAENMTLRHIPLTMQDWEKRLNSFIEMFDYGILQDAGKVSAEIAKLHAETEFEKYRVIQDRLFMSDFDKYMLELEENTKK